MIVERLLFDPPTNKRRTVGSSGSWQRRPGGFGSAARGGFGSDADIYSVGGIPEFRAAELETGAAEGGGWQRRCPEGGGGSGG